MANALETLDVFPERMRANIDATGGTIYAEPVTLRLRAALGRDAAQSAVTQALARSREGMSFADALSAIPDVARVIPREELAQMMRPEQYLGEAETIRRALLSRHGAGID
jgi:3-carboxy-cis,cis-muconate cycloisomerase